MNHTSKDSRVTNALAAPEPSTRLRAALFAGSHPDPDIIGTLIERCAVEPDFYVRDMLTWALTRHPAAITVPMLLQELTSDVAQARSQALHTLSKIGDQSVWSAIPMELLHDVDDEVARSAWRAAVALVPAEHEALLVAELKSELGRADRDVQLSLSRALIALEDAVIPMLTSAMDDDDPDVRAHAIATEQLLRDPESEFAGALDDAMRHVLLGSAPQVDETC